MGEQSMGDGKRRLSLDKDSTFLFLADSVTVWKMEDIRSAEGIIEKGVGIVLKHSDSDNASECHVVLALQGKDEVNHLVDLLLDAKQNVFGC